MLRAEHAPPHLQRLALEQDAVSLAGIEDLPGDEARVEGGDDEPFLELGLIGLSYLVEVALCAVGLLHLRVAKDHDDEDDLWLIPTAEVPLTNLHRDEILSPGELPLNYVAFTPCFRREKAAAGRDTRGIKRLHQFEKVEMYRFVEPSQSPAALDQLIAEPDIHQDCSRYDSIQIASINNSHVFPPLLA